MNRVPPAIRSGPLSRTDAETLNRALGEIYGFLGSINVAAPLSKKTGPTGLQIWLDTNALGNQLGQNNNPTATVSLTSHVAQTINLASGGTASVYPAQLWSESGGVWTAGASVWFWGLNGEAPPVNARLLVEKIDAEQTTGVIVYAKELLFGLARLTSTSTSSVSVQGGGSLTCYPAHMRVLNNTAALTNQLTVWFYPLNGNTPATGIEYFVDEIGTDTTGVPIMAADPIGYGSGSSGLDLDIGHVAATLTANVNNTLNVSGTTTPITEVDLSVGGGGSATITEITPFTLASGDQPMLILINTGGSITVADGNHIHLSPAWVSRGSSVLLGVPDSITFIWEPDAPSPGWYEVACTVYPQGSMYSSVTTGVTTITSGTVDSISSIVVPEKTYAFVSYEVALEQPQTAQPAWCFLQFAVDGVGVTEGEVQLIVQPAASAYNATAPVAGPTQVVTMNARLILSAGTHTVSVGGTAYSNAGPGSPPSPPNTTSITASYRTLTVVIPSNSPAP